MIDLLNQLYNPSTNHQFKTETIKIHFKFARLKGKLLKFLELSYEIAYLYSMVLSLTSPHSILLLKFPWHTNIYLYIHTYVLRFYGLSPS